MRWPSCCRRGAIMTMDCFIFNRKPTGRLRRAACAAPPATHMWRAPRIGGLITIACALFPLLMGSCCGPPRPSSAEVEVIRRFTEDCATYHKEKLYLHHFQVSPGERGYGLTALDGTQIVRFEVRIESVLRKGNTAVPREDLILARVWGRALSGAGAIAGMSGAPVYVRRHASDRLIGAVAYSWANQKQFGGGHLIGIQPIANMLPLLAPARSQPGVADGGATTPCKSVARLCLSPQWKGVAFAPEFRDLRRLFGCGTTAWSRSASDANRTNALDVSYGWLLDGVDKASLLRLCISQADPTLQHDAPGQAAAIKPGSSLGVPLVMGDQNWATIGTVTDVVGRQVLAFGHSMFSKGAVDYPLTGATVDAVVASTDESYKMARTTTLVGALHTDQSAGVAGTLGDVAPQIPLDITVRWLLTGEESSYRYLLIYDPEWTTRMAARLTVQSILGRRELPENHLLKYASTIDFGAYGTLIVENQSACDDVDEMLVDLFRSIRTMSRAFSTSVLPQRISISVQIDEGGPAALKGAVVDRASYAPGDAVVTTVQLRSHDGGLREARITLELPSDLPDGKYKLQVFDASAAAEVEQMREPWKYDPGTVLELLESLKSAGRWRRDTLYAVIECAETGVVCRGIPITQVPTTLIQVLSSGRLADLGCIKDVVEGQQCIDTVVQGKAETELIVCRSLL